MARLEIHAVLRLLVTVGGDWGKIGIYCSKYTNEKRKWWCCNFTIRGDVRSSLPRWFGRDVASPQMHHHPRKNAPVFESGQVTREDC